MSRPPRQAAGLPSSVVTHPPHSIAVIDGKLCRLNQTARVVATHAPLATAVLEFRHGPMRLYVREHPYGLLPGVPNLYCLDSHFRLLWLAEWPLPEDPCGRIVDEVGGNLVVESVAGVTVRVDAETGRSEVVASSASAAG